jgi:glycosyltransferase involved in cell wall biosynthesis
VIISSSHEETFGQTIIEGYACGTPAVVFNNAALPELIDEGKTGLVVETIDEFSKSLIQLSSNRGQTAEISEQAYDLFQEKYTSKSQIKELLKIFEKTKPKNH